MSMLAFGSSNIQTRALKTEVGKGSMLRASVSVQTYTKARTTSPE